MRLFIKFIFSFLLLIFIGPTPSLAKTIYGAGATFPAPLYQEWAREYEKKSHTHIVYKAIGSGAGIREILAGTVTFGATDAPLPAQELEKNNLIQFPIIISGIVPIINIPNIPRGALLLDSQTLAKIYLGTIQHWDDSNIKELNPELNLPHLPIHRVYRQDSSGSSFILSHYLAQTDDAFKKKMGTTKELSFPEGVPAKDSNSMVGLVKEIEGAIGYVGYIYAINEKINYARLINHDGIPVSPNPLSFDSAVANAAWKKGKGFDLILTNQPGVQSWPLTSASFIIMKKNPKNLTKALKALDFFDWAYHQGRQTAARLNYVALSGSLSSLIHHEWHSLRKQQKKPRSPM